MDIQRTGVAEKKRRQRIIYSVLGLVAIGLVTLGLSRLKPAAPTVERATIWVDAVKRGQMLRQVRGLGTLVPEEIRWIPALTEGRVEKIVLRPGTIVKPDTVILELSNDVLQRDLLDAELQLKAAEAEYSSTKVRLESDLLNQRASAAAIQADYHQAQLQSEADAQLLKEGLTSELISKISQSKADSLGTRQRLEDQRLANATESTRAQLAVQQARVDQSRALFELRRNQLDALHVRAGMDGVLQLVPVEVGQRVAQGANLARVADPKRLKAEVRIAETQAKDVQIGQVASIDTRNGIVAGRVIRIDPAVQNGTVTVDVGLEGDLPQGARPDLSVDGTVELERLENVLYVGRPVNGQANSSVGLFKVQPDGEAIRVKVGLGRSSVNTIEVVDGLQVGDQVVLSDMSAWDAVDRVRLR